MGVVAESELDEEYPIVLYLLPLATTLDGGVVGGDTAKPNRASSGHRWWSTPAKAAPARGRADDSLAVMSRR